MAKIDPNKLRAELKKSQDELKKKMEAAQEKIPKVDEAAIKGLLGKTSNTKEDDDWDG